MPAKNGFQLTDDDIQILDYVYRLRLATIDHMTMLTGRSVRALWGRLLRLKQRRYLSCVARLMQKHVYALGAEGVPVLIEQGYAPRDLAEKRLRYSELKEIGIRHSLFVADIHTRMLTLSRHNAITLSHWQEGSSTWDSVVVRDGDPAIPIRPDAYFILKHTERPDGKNKVHVFLEADRSTMSHSRMAQKIRGYVGYYERERHLRKYPGMRAFVVATVTLTRSRAQNLREALHPLIPHAAWRDAYLFIPFEDLSLTTLLPRATAAAQAP